MKTILVGGGGHALSLLELLGDYDQIAGYADCQPSEQMPIPYLGTDEEVLSNYPPEGYDIHVTLVYTTEVNLQLRSRVINKYQAYSHHTFIAPTAIVTPYTEIGNGCAVFHKAVVNRSEIGCNSIINTGAIIEHGCKIGHNVFIGPGTIICGGVTIGDNTLIGAGAIVRDDVEIGANITLGMGSVVTKSILQAGVYAGTPAKSIK